MKKFLRYCLLGSFILLNYSLAFAQDTSVSGTVTSAVDNSPIPGVSVVVKGTTNGTVTDADGKYQLVVSSDAVLVLSSVGFSDTEITVEGRSAIDVSMSEDVTALGEVVVTALGISREKRSLTYAADEISGQELNQSKDASFINAIAGKVSGIQINRSSSGVGGSTRVILRGNASTTNNNVLYVIDGVPMLNYSTSQATSVWGLGSNGTGGAGRDGGDAISNLNPEDIESLTVLKGASAAALYGSQAANGAILITTKKGKPGEVTINFTSNYVSETVLINPELQYKYGQTSPGNLNSWGGSVSASDHVEDFFKTGSTWINSIAISGGDETAQTYFSYANTSSNGIIPTASFDKHNFNLKETAQFLNDKLKVSGNVNVITQEGNNRPTSGLYYNPLTGLYQFPRGLDFDTYKDDFEVFDPNRNVNVQNWTADKDTQQNPYWILNRNKNQDKRTRFIMGGQVEYGISDELSVRVKGTLDKTTDEYTQKSFASTQATLADANGRYVWQSSRGTQKYGEALVVYNNTWDIFSFSGLVGFSVNDQRIFTEFADSKNADLQFANVFSLQNIAQPGASFNQTANNSQLQSMFGSFSFGYKGVFYLDITGRNDWSSTLAFTENESFFYPSFGATVVLNELLDLPQSIIDLLKIRGSYAQVGNSVGFGDTNVLNPITNQGVQTPSAVIEPGKTLMPEQQTSVEFGIDMSFYQGKFGFDFTFYNNKTIDQRILIDAPPGAGVSRFIINAGEIENKGIELGINARPISKGDFSWEVNFNLARNRNKVIEVSDLLSDGTFFISAESSNSYGLVIRKGGVFGEIYGRKFERLNGTIVVDDTGAPQKEAGLGLIGDINPDFTAGLNNTLNYKKFWLNVLIDGHFGGDVISITEAENDLRGVTRATADARDVGGVTIDAVLADGTSFSGPIDSEVFYTAVGGRAGITEYYTYSATNIRLRELSVGYTFPVGNTNFIQNLRLSIVGRNLFFFKIDAPFDPDISLSTGTGLQGVDSFSPPSTRSLGLNLSVTF